MYKFFIGSVLLIFIIQYILPLLFQLEEYDKNTNLLYREVSSPHGQIERLSNGEIVHYFLQGPKDGNLVIVTHGISTTSRTMLPLTTPLSQKGFRVLSFDFYGRGHSSSPLNLPQDEVLFSNQTKDLLDSLFYKNIISRRQYNGFHLIGYSLGGAVLVTFAAQFYSRVESLTLLAPAGLSFDIPISSSLVTFPIIWDIMRTNPITRVLLNQRIINAFQRPEEFSHLIEEEKMSVYYHLNNDIFPEAFRSTLQYFPINNCTYSYEKVGKASYPVMVIWGLEDQTVPFQCAQQALQLIPRAELVSIEFGGHMAFVEENEKVINAITRHLMLVSEDKLSTRETIDKIEQQNTDMI